MPVTRDAERSLARSLRAGLLKRPSDAVVTICASRVGGTHHCLSGNALDEAAVACGAALTACYDPAAGPLAMVMPTGHEFVTTLFGAIYAGFTITALAPPRPGVPTERFNKIVADCRPQGILCSQSLIKRVGAALQTAGEKLSAPEPTLVPQPIEGGSFADFDTRFDPVRPVILQYTSGSTRAPLGVVLRSDAILANSELADRTWGVGVESRTLSWLPHFHDMGLMSILYPVLHGGVTALMDPLHMIQRPSQWLKLITELGSTCSGGPSFAYAHVLANVGHEDCDGLDLSRWRQAFCGAEPVPATLLAAFRARFARYGLDPCAVFSTYGLAENTLLVAGMPGHLPPDAVPSGCETIEPCRIADELSEQLKMVDPQTRRPVADGTAGEVWVCGASVASGYLGDAAGSDQAFAAELDDPAFSHIRWLRTGDLATRDGNALYITGRLKDLLLANGRKVSAPDVEWLAAEQDVALNPMAAAAVMIDEQATGKAVLLIERRDRLQRIDDETELRKRISRAVSGTWSIELTDIVFLTPNALPRTTSGKVQRRAAAQAYRDGAFAMSTAA